MKTQGRSGNDAASLSTESHGVSAIYTSCLGSTCRMLPEDEEGRSGRGITLLFSPRSRRCFRDHKPARSVGVKSALSRCSIMGRALVVGTTGSACARSRERAGWRASGLLATYRSQSCGY